MRKRIICSVLTAALMSSLLLGCGGSDSSSASSASASGTSTSASTSDSASASESSATSEASTEVLELSDVFLMEHLAEYSGSESMEGKKIGMTVQSLGNDFMIALTNAISDAVTAQGASIQFDSCDADSVTQIEQIENYVTMGMDLIVVFPVNGESLVSAIDQASEDGIPTMAFAMEIPSDNLTVTMKSAEEAEMGQACAEIASDWIDETFPDAADGEVNVLVIGCEETPEAAERSAALENISQLNSKVTLKRQDTADWNSFDVGRSTTENEFLIDSSYNVILAVNATTALGANSYLTSSDSPLSDLSQIGIFTVDETEEVLSRIKESATNESILRGTVSLGNADTLAETFIASVTPVLTNGTVVNRVIGTAEKITADTLNS